jgi:hypothetical protein
MLADDLGLSKRVFISDEFVTNNGSAIFRQRTSSS